MSILVVQAVSLTSIIKRHTPDDYLLRHVICSLLSYLGSFVYIATVRLHDDFDVLKTKRPTSGNPG